MTTNHPVQWARQDNFSLWIVPLWYHLFCWNQVRNDVEGENIYPGSGNTSLWSQLLWALLLKDLFFVSLQRSAGEEREDSLKEWCSKKKTNIHLHNFPLTPSTVQEPRHAWCWIFALAPEYKNLSYHKFPLLIRLDIPESSQKYVCLLMVKWHGAEAFSLFLLWEPWSSFSLHDDCVSVWFCIIMHISAHVRTMGCTRRSVQRNSLALRWRPTTIRLPQRAARVARRVRAGRDRKRKVPLTGTARRPMLITKLSWLLWDHTHKHQVSHDRQDPSFVSLCC